MTGPRTNTTRRAALGLTCGLACGLWLVLGTGCASKQQPSGGSTAPKAEKARKEAEDLAVSAVNAAATAQVKAVPDLASHQVNTLLDGRVAIAPDPGAAGGAPKTDAKNPPAPATPPKGGASKAEAPKPQEVAQVPAEKRRAPKVAPRPGPAPVIREVVINTVPYPTEAEAEEEAIALARDIVEQKLAALDPPIHYRPSVNEVRTEFLNKNSRNADWLTEDEKRELARYGVTGNRVYVTYYVEVTGDQVRELRAQERVSTGLRGLGVLVTLALSAFLFLRADEWTRGYMTRTLAVLAIVFGAGAVAALIFV